MMQAVFHVVKFPNGIECAVLYSSRDMHFHRTIQEVLQILSPLCTDLNMN